MGDRKQNPVLRFGVFEASLSSGELRKHGLLIRVPSQPFKILAILLERPGDVVTRDELRRNLWSAETFVDFEHSLNSAVKKLREALGDSAENPRYIETLPRVGYRFIAPVSSNGLGVPVGEPVVPGSRARLAYPKLLAISAAVFAIGGLIWLAVRNSRPLIAQQDSIVLADFENRTGDAAFDGALKRVLEIELSQSPYLRVLPDQDVRQTLEYMRRRPAEPITKPIGLEICQRNAMKAMLSGSISSLGKHYVVTLEAMDCATGTLLAGATAEAESKERVLAALDNTSAKLRRKLGESLASIRKFDTPITEATTGSLEALKMYALGEDLRRQGKPVESLPFFQRAVEIDPQFTLAYGRLGSVYANLNEMGLARQYLGKAFQLRERTSERERLYLAARYFDNVSGEAGKAIENYELWRSAYPRDWTPVNNLAAEYTVVGQYGKAIELGREAVRINPNHVFSYEALARAYKRSTRYAEAKAVCESAIAKGLESWGLHSILYQIAFGEGDRRAMQREVQWGMGKPTEDQTLMDEGWAAATSGRLRESRELFRRAQGVAAKDGFPDNAAAAAVSLATVEAMFHNFAEAARVASAALTMKGANVSEDAALVLAWCGDVARAQSLADDLVRHHPLNTIVNEVSVPRIWAEIELQRGQPKRAVDLLRRAAPYELREFSVLYLRGLSYLAARMAADAAREFQAILKNPGVDPLSPYYPLAHLGLAQAHAMQGDPAASRHEYQALFDAWKDADPDIRVLREARSLLAALPH